MSAAEFDLFMGGEDEEAQDLPSSLGAYHAYYVLARTDGTAAVTEFTNDPDDDGHPDAEVQSRHTEFGSLELALSHTGRSGVRPSGVNVTVQVNGKFV